MSALKYYVVWGYKKRKSWSKSLCPIKLFHKVVTIENCCWKNTQQSEITQEQDGFGSILLPCPWDKYFTPCIECCVLHCRTMLSPWAQQFFFMRSQWSIVALHAHENSYNAPLTSFMVHYWLRETSSIPRLQPIRPTLRSQTSS